MTTPPTESRSPARSRARAAGAPSIFLQRASYRRRRLADAARLLPIFGLCIVFVPLLWSSDTPVSLSGALIYIFSAWVTLILVVAVFGALARRVEGDAPLGDLDEDTRP